MIYGQRLTPPQWPQDTLQIPNAAGRFMPPVELGNVAVARQEAFMVSGTFTFTSEIAGQQLTQIVPTPQDGDFWCDQLFAASWISTSSINQPAPRAELSIRDIRTGRSLTYPRGMPLQFINTATLFSDDPGFDPASSPPPAGFRSTSTLPEAFCFTRQGGIELTVSFLYDNGAGGTRTLDIAFGGWKEYTYAARGQGV